MINNRIKSLHLSRILSQSMINSCMSPKPMPSMLTISIYYLLYLLFLLLDIWRFCSVLLQLTPCFHIDSIPFKGCIPLSQTSTHDLLESALQISSYCSIIWSIHDWHYNTRFSAREKDLHTK